MKANEILKESSNVLTTVWRDGSNTYYVRYFLEKGIIRSSNQHRVPLSHSYHMFMRADLNGTQAKRDAFTQTIKQAKPTTNEELAEVVRKVTKINHWTAG